MTRSALLALCLALPAAAAPRVLLIWDTRSEQTDVLIEAMRASGAEVALSDTNGNKFTGENPSLAGFDVVVHLNGTTWHTDMPRSGQAALEKFVREGGGYVHHEWNAYQLGVGQLQLLRPLTLFDRVSGFGPGEITVRKVETVGSHPVMWEVPKEWHMTGSSNIGKAHVFETQRVTVLARDTAGNDAVAVREYGLGRVVGFHHGGNWGMDHYGATVNNLNAREVRRMFSDGVRWAWGCDPGFREPHREKVCAEIIKNRRR